MINDREQVIAAKTLANDKLRQRGEFLRTQERTLPLNNDWDNSYKTCSTLGSKGMYVR